MTLTVLLDLDDTLLGNDINAFLPAYLKQVGVFLAEYVEPRVMIQNLLAGTKAMLANTLPDKTLEEVFDAVYYPAIGRSKAEMAALLETFYREVFPTLRPLTTLRPEAHTLVQTALEHRHALVVATNPIFPRAAILERLRWAGLDPDKTAFSLITDYTNFHFAKPNPAFYTEILAHLGWPNRAAVMIGNSLEDDLLPAALLGLPVFWVVNQPATLPEGLPAYSACGTLAEASQWIEELSEIFATADAATPAGQADSTHASSQPSQTTVQPQDIRQPALTPSAMIAALNASPAALDTMTKSLTEYQWHTRPAPAEWSITEIIFHLRDVDQEVNLPRLTTIMNEEEPFLGGINTDTWVEARGYRHKDGRLAFQEWIQARMQLLELLRALTPEEWLRPARHAIFGPTTLMELVGFMLTHDQIHVRQCLTVIRSLDESSQ